MVNYANKGSAVVLKNKDLWLAHSEDHGWVVLDRSLPVNKCSDMTEEFLFTRCRDGQQYQQGDQPWNYKAASRYLEKLPMKEAMEAEQELSEMMEAFAA